MTDQQVLEKICSKCGTQKSLTEFTTNNRSKDGKHYHCRVCMQLKQSAWRANNPERQKINDKRARRKLRDDVLRAYSDGEPKCACCGENTWEFLCIDHTENNGAESRKEHGRGNSYYFYLRKNNYPTGYRVLCHNCNVSRQYYGECPHKQLVLAEDRIGYLRKYLESRDD